MEVDGMQEGKEPGGDNQASNPTPTAREQEKHQELKEKMDKVKAKMGEA